MDERNLKADTAAGRRALRLMLVTETYPPEINGVANTLHQMVTHLARRGHDITLLRPARRRKEPVRTGERVREIPTPGCPLPLYRGLQIGLPAGRTLSRIMGEIRPDLVYIATEGPLGASARHRAQRFRVPVVAGFHTNFHTYSRYYGLGAIAPAVLGYLRRFHNRCARTLVPTQALQTELQGRGFERLALWPRGIDTGLFDPARRDQSLRDQWGVGAGERAVLYVGRIAREKNIGLAIEAFQAIRQRWPGSRFILVGAGPEMAAIRDGHPDFVITGTRTGEPLAAHYASADLFLFPSRSETFGNVITEAMASGLPVVAFDQAAAHSLIRHEENGLLAKPGQDAGFLPLAVRAAADKSLREALGAQARADMLPLGWPRVIDRLEQLFDEVIDDHLRGHRHESLVATLD